MPPPRQPTAAASSVASGNVLGPSPGGRKPKGHDQAGSGKDSPGQAPRCCSHAPQQSQRVPSIWGRSWLRPQILLLPPQPRTMSRLPFEQDGSARAFVSPSGPSHCLPPPGLAPAALLLCAHCSPPGTEMGRSLTPRQPGTPESTSDPTTGIYFPLHVSRET